MDVDVDNYSEVREFICSQRLIQNSEVISLDLQFAGLKFQGNDRDRPEYLPAEKYQKMSAVARKYCIMQVGVTFFIPQQSSKRVIAYPFNFYVFPRPTIYGDPVVSMQSGCVSFNIANKMDWSRWIQKGITYMKLTQYERINDIQQKARKFDELYDFLDDQIKTLVKKIFDQIRTQQNNGKQNLIEKKIFQVPSSSFNFTKKVIEKYFEQYSKLYIVNQIINEEKLKQQELIEFRIVKISQKQKENIEKKKNQELYGFTLLFQKIWNSGKALIGHNFFFDLLFIYDAFIGALPYDYHFFKRMLNQSYNSSQQSGKMVAQEQESKKKTFYDTKFISSNLNSFLECFDEKTSLEGLYKSFNSNLKDFKKRQICLGKGFEKYDLKNQILHEAGFDAYLTGWIYYQLKQLSKPYQIDFDKQYKGKINLNRSYFYLDLQQTSDGVCNYQKVFYIQIVEPKKFMAMEFIKKQRSDVYKTLKELFKNENIAKDVILREGLKQVFIEIKEKKIIKKITGILLKCVTEKKIKGLYTLVNFLEAKKAKQWADQYAKNLNSKGVAV